MEPIYDIIILILVMFVVVETTEIYTDEMFTTIGVSSPYWGILEAATETYIRALIFCENCLAILISWSCLQCWKRLFAR